MLGCNLSMTDSYLGGQRRFNFCCFLRGIIDRQYNYPHAQSYEIACWAFKGYRYARNKRRTLQPMKRGASSEPEGAPQRSEKAAKDGDVEPGLVQADPLLELLCTFTAVDKARRWKDVLYDRDVVSLDDLVGLARDKEAWDAFHAALAQQEPVLASKLNAWRQGLGLREPSAGDSPGKLWRKRSFSLCFLVYSFAALPRLASSSPLV